MSDRPRDAQGQFANESGNETMNRLLRERRDVRQAPKRQPETHARMNTLLRQAAGRLPVDEGDDEPDEAA